MKKKILVSGGTGFIGYHIVKKDIQKKLRKNYDYVVNLAGYVNHVEKKKTFSSHYNGSKNLADHFKKKKIKSFVQISSGAEYGNLKSPHNEKIKCFPASNYGKAKYFATKHLLKLFKQNKFPCTILRLYQIFGPKQDQNRFIPVVIKNSLENKKFNVSSGKQQRDFLYVDDVVDAVIKCLIKKKSRGEIFNVGCGKPFEIKKILLLIVKICKGGTPIYGKINLRKEENLITYPSTNKIKKFLNWKPKYSFSNGLKKTIKLYAKK